MTSSGIGWCLRRIRRLWRRRFLAAGRAWLGGLFLVAAALLLVPLLWRLLAHAKTNSPTRQEAAAAEAGILADIRGLLKRPAFHALFWSFLICGYTTTGVIETHFLPYASFCGFAPLPVARSQGTLTG